ncbi:MAG TPA: glycosyltransferase family 2 protein [Gammaproteobacteria bacterium]
MISVVVPAYNEERNVDTLYARLREQLRARHPEWELVFVDDGSTDGTWDRIVALNAADPRVRGVRLSRNFGHQSALLAGLAAARGAAVVSMDADLQHPPGVVSELLEKWQEGYQVVNAIRIDTERVPRWKRWSSRVFYRLFSLLSGVDIAPGSADFRLLDRQVLDEILRFKEEGLFLRGIVHWVGYPTASVKYQCGERHAGESKYSLRKMLRLAWHGVSSFSLVPLRIGIFVGLLSSAIAFFGVIYAIVGWWLDNDVIPGWASSVAISSFLFGVLFAFLAILAEYVGRILVEVRGRPRFLVRETTRASAPVERLRARPVVLDASGDARTRTAG